MTPIFTEWNVFFEHASMPQWQWLQYSVDSSISLIVFILTLTELTTGCFLGCRGRIWGGDRRSRSVSWHDRFHSECCEWPPSNPGGETWEGEAQEHRYIDIYLYNLFDKEATAFLPGLEPAGNPNQWDATESNANYTQYIYHSKCWAYYVYSRTII